MGGSTVAEQNYSLLVLGMRYVFTAILLYVLLRIVLQSFREYRNIRKVKRQIEGNYAASLLLVRPEVFYGTRFILGRESRLGRARACEIRLSMEGVARKHACFFRDKDGVYMKLRKSEGCFINGKTAEKGEYLLEAGDELRFGEAVLLFSIRAGMLREEDEDA